MKIEKKTRTVPTFTFLTCGFIEGARFEMIARCIKKTTRKHNTVSETGAEERAMIRPSGETVMERLYELCPEIRMLGIHPIVLQKGSRY